jgi:hypothetical protein
MMGMNPFGGMQMPMMGAIPPQIQQLQGGPVNPHINSMHTQISQLQQQIFQLNQMAQLQAAQVA